MSMLKRRLEYFHVGYRVITGIIIYFGSYLFAINVSMNLFVSDNNVAPFIVAGLIGSFVNYLLYRFYSKHYHYWYLFKRVRGGVDLRSVFYLPPVSTFFMAVALTAFFANHFFLRYREVWQESLISIPRVVDFIADEMIVLILLSIFIFVFPFLFLRYGFRRWGEGQKVKFLLYSIVFIGIPLSIYIVGSYLKIHKEISIIVMEFLHHGTYIILGFIPIHWIYELFVAPFKDKIQFKRFSGKIQN